MRRDALAACVTCVTSLWACGDRTESARSTTAAIVGGTADTTDAAVVWMARSNCSGALVDPRAVLTAAHCAVGAGDPVSFPDGTSIAALAFHAEPAWDPATAGNDIAVVVLSEPATIAPLATSTTPLDSSIVGRPVRIVGYGTDGDGGAPGTERTGFTTIASYDATTFTDDAQPSASCAGDSGGPALLSTGGVERIVGVTSRGDAACRSFGTKTRVDAYASFLQAAIEATRPGALAVGARCDGDLECASGACVPAADSPADTYCSAACNVDADCPTAMVCSANACAYTPPTPGALGSPCEADGDCVGELCVESAFGGARTCSTLCVQSAEAPCPTGFACAAIGDAGSACFPSDGGASTPEASGGGRTCAVTAPGTAGRVTWPGLAAAPAFAIAARRRRRYERGRGAGTAG